MRELYVIEVIDASGQFRPQVGFADMARVEEWMVKFLPEDMRAHTGQWRIVKYVPQVLDIKDYSLVH